MDFTLPKIAPWVHGLPLMRRKNKDPHWSLGHLHMPSPPPAKPAAKNTGGRFPPIKGLEPKWSGAKENSSFREEFTSRPLHFQPTPPPEPLPVTATQPVVVNKPTAYNSPGSRIPILDRRRKLRPVQAVVQPINNMAAHSVIKDEPAQVERAVRKKPSNIRAAPQAVGKGQVVVQPLLLPSLTSEEPLNRPEEALGQALGLLQDEEWERKTEGLRLVRALAEHHAEVVLPELHYISAAVIAEVQNLRSIVSRGAITTMAHLFTHLQCDMDSEVEVAARTLLHKAGETSLFIRQGVELALSTMVLSCSPGRVLQGLLDGGIRHRNPVCRAATALSLVRLLQVVGVSRVLTGRKTFASKFIPAVSTLAFDAAQDVRTHARAALCLLGCHKEAERAVEKYVQLRDQSEIKKLLCK
ncbi:TOG array regulator of axonemal microtubules protein 1-like [Astyanax mexicanus]|uniref:TOG array regulator of axonemal microtubules protein 1-like n=2 Tax=Astyanax mexicanus TaxID=7994 RepID=A0A8T2KR07_ASTMX|nr:TOG array regulator of axonemal microtubules protein 1-like [Astyanax mexicanus]